MKKLLPVLLCAAMLLCLLPLEARAAAAAWDGTVDISWYDPAQTEYTIDTPAKLAGLAALVNGMAPSRRTLPVLRARRSAASIGPKSRLLRTTSVTSRRAIRL